MFAKQATSKWSWQRERPERAPGGLGSFQPCAGPCLATAPLQSWEASNPDGARSCHSQHQPQSCKELWERGARS